MGWWGREAFLRDGYDDAVWDPSIGCGGGRRAAELRDGVDVGEGLSALKNFTG